MILGEGIHPTTQYPPPTPVITLAPAPLPQRERGGRKKIGSMKTAVRNKRNAAFATDFDPLAAVGGRGGMFVLAAAIAEAAKAVVSGRPGIENRDILEFTSAVFRKMYTKTYLEMVVMTPFLWSFFYDHLDDDSQGTNNLGDKLRKVVEKLNFLSFPEFSAVSNLGMLVIGHQHFLPAELVAQQKLKGKFDSPQVTVCTDFIPHRIWVNEPCDHYFCCHGRRKVASGNIGNIPAEEDRHHGHSGSMAALC